MDKIKRKAWLEERMAAWSLRRNPPGDKATLHRKNILILPTSYGMLLVLAATVVFVAAINYENSLAFGLAFMMFSIFIVAMIHGFRNLNGLELTAMPTTPVFCGEDAAFQVLLSDVVERRHENLELKFAGSTVSKANLTGYRQQQITVFSRTNNRGEHKVPPLYVRSSFPTGLFTAWSIVNLNLHCLVYPKPSAVSLGSVLDSSVTVDESDLVRAGSEDFYGFRSYTPGDSLKQVAWKQVARGQAMQVKQFVDYIDEQVWLSWDMFNGCSDEERLSRLCYCVLKLSATSTTYGLKLPALQVSPDLGKPHKMNALKALALYRLPGNTQREAS